MNGLAIKMECITRQLLIEKAVNNEDARGRIISMKPLPSLEESFNMIKWEESRKVLTNSSLSSASSNTSRESSALAARGNQGNAKGKKSNKWCDRC